MINLLKVNHLTKIYGETDQENAVVALDDVQFSVDAGEFIAIMGPSGSGKTTLLNIMSGIDTPTSGEVILDDENLHTMNKDQQAVYRRRQIGFIFQDFNLLDSLSIKDNILLPMILEKKSVEEMEGKFTELIDIFDIQQIAHKYPHEVSGGQKQRAAICRSLVNEPSIVFADEPTGNLDSKNASILMENLEKIVHLLHTTVLIVTHDVFAASYCDKVLFIQDGTLHSFIVKKDSRKAFLDQIIDHLAMLGGKKHDI